MPQLNLDEKETFELLYDGINNTERPLKGSETRVVSSILDKFEAIGEPVMRGGPTFTLKQPAPLQLNAVEVNLLLDILEHVPWTAKAARKVSSVLDRVRRLLGEDANVSNK